MNRGPQASRRRLSARHRAGFGLALLLFASGCLTVGAPFPTDPIASLRVGETTRAEVHQLLGDPFRTGLEDGDPTWTWLDYHASLFGSTGGRDLVVRFDARGVVKTYSYNSTDPGDTP